MTRCIAEPLSRRDIREMAYLVRRVARKENDLYFFNVYITDVPSFLPFCYRYMIPRTKKAATKSLLSCQAEPVLFIVLAALVSYRTGSLAGRLAGSLALAAAALFHGVF